MTDRSGVPASPGVPGRRVGAGAAGLALHLLPVLIAAAGCARSTDVQVDPPQRLVATAIAFVQSNYATPQTSTATVNVPFSAVQSAGNLNVVIAGWNDTTARITSVTDTKGNAYQLAVGPTAPPGALSQSIYYAKNIAAAAAAANVVTVTFSTPADFADIRVLEYSGLDQSSPLDVAAAAAGNSATSSSGAVTTTNANDLLVAGNTVATFTGGPGPGFTQRVITQPDGDIAEDWVVSAVGSYSATAPLVGAGPWIMQIVAFKAMPSGPPPPPPTAPASLAAAAAGTAQINLPHATRRDRGQA